MPLNQQQLEILRQAHNILSNSSLIDIPLDEGFPDVPCLQEYIQEILSTSNGSLPPFLPNYSPPPAHTFTPEEIDLELHRTTRQAIIHKIVKHPLHAIIEYPESGSIPAESVAHTLPADHQGFTHPKANIQYGLATHRGHQNIRCSLLRDNGPDKYVL